jgi:hypothetical protein
VRAAKQPALRLRLPSPPLYNDGTTTMTILLLLLGVAGFGAMAGYVLFCERV